KYGELRLPEEVDKAGGDDIIVGVDRVCRGDIRKIADGNDRVAADADVAAIPRRAGAVDDASVDDFQIEHVRFGLRGASGCEKAEGRKQKAEVDAWERGRPARCECSRQFC